MIDSNRYPRESVEYIAVTVTLDGTIVTTGVSFALTTGADRPSEWTPAVVVGDGIGLLLSGREVGVWHVWAKVGTVVIDCGVLQVV